MKEFYGLSILEQPMLDRFKYRGRGRPRKIDYSSFEEINKKLNAERARVLGVPK